LLPRQTVFLIYRKTPLPDGPYNLDGAGLLVSRPALVQGRFETPACFTYLAPGGPYWPTVRRPEHFHCGACNIMGLSSGPTEPTAQSRRHERMLKLIVWLAFAALCVGILWWHSDALQPPTTPAG